MCGGKGTSTATSTSAPPQYIQDAYKYIENQAKTVAGQPLQQYGGPTLAGFTPLQNTAFSGLANAQNITTPFTNYGSNLVGSATQFDPNQLQQFMSPYNQNVVNSTLNTINEQNAQQQNALRGNAVASGAWGGDRAGVAQAALAGQQDLAKNQTISQLYNNNYAQALQANQALQGNQLQGAGLMGYLGSGALQNQIGATGAQLAAGNQQQQLQQQALNIPYQLFQQQQAYPFQTTQFLANTLLGNAGTQGGTSSTTQPQQGNTFSQLLGLGLGIAGLFQDGGAVGGYASGGGVPDVSVSFIPLSGNTGGMGGSGIPAPPQMSQNQDSSLQNILGPLMMEKQFMNSDNKPPIFGNGNNINHPSPFNSNFAGSNVQNALKYGSTNDLLNQIQSAPTSQGGMMANDMGGWFASAMPFADGGATVNLPPQLGMNPSMPDFTANPSPIDPTAGTPAQAYIPSNFNPLVAGTPVYSFNPLAVKGMGVSVPDVLHGGTGTGTGTGANAASTPFTGPSYQQFLDMGLAGIGTNPHHAYNELAQSFGFTPHHMNGTPLHNPLPTAANGGTIKAYADAGSVTSPSPSENYFVNMAALAGDPSMSNIPDFSVSPLGKGIGSQQMSPLASAVSSPQGIPAAPQIQAPQESAQPSGIPQIDSSLTNVDPRLALSAAGFAMAASPSRNALQAIGQGASAGLENYIAQKKGAAAAQEKAQQLAIEAERYQRLADSGKYQVFQGNDGKFYSYDSQHNSLSSLETPQGVDKLTPVAGTGTGSGRTAAAIQLDNEAQSLYDQYQKETDPEAKQEILDHYNRVMRLSKSMGPNQQYGSDFSTLEPKKGSESTAQLTMPQKASQVLTANNLPTEMHVLDKNMAKSHQADYDSAESAWNASRNTQMAMQEAAPTITKAYNGMGSEWRANAEAAAASVLGINPSEAATATQELNKMSNTITTAAFFASHSLRFGIGMEQFYKNSTIQSGNTPAANMFIYDNAMRLPQVMLQNKNLISFTKNLDDQQKSAVEDEFYKDFPPMVPVSPKQAGGQKNVYEVNPAYQDPGLVNNWLQGKTTKAVTEDYVQRAMKSMNLDRDSVVKMLQDKGYSVQ